MSTLEKIPTLSETVNFPDATTVANTLDLSSEAISHLNKFFDEYCREKGIVLTNETMVMRGIRQFLKERKDPVKALFQGTILSESGCFPHAIKCLLIASAHGVEVRLARSKRASRALHILVVREDGSPFDPTEPTRGSAKRISLAQIRHYVRFVQPVVSSVDRWRKRQGM